MHNIDRNDAIKEMNKQIIKNFFEKFPYHTMHEAGNSEPDMEYFFVIVPKKDITHPVVAEHIMSYIHNNPVKDLSNGSMQYLKRKSNDFFFILVDKLNKNDLFYSKNETLVKENANNILCVKMTGEPADLTTHLGNYAEKYVKQFADISVSVGLVAKDSIQEGLVKGKDLFKEKAPAIKKNIGDLQNKFSKKLSEFRNKKQ